MIYPNFECAKQCRLNACAHWAVARGPHEHMIDSMLIYVCCICMFLLLKYRFFFWKYQLQ